MSEQKCDWNLKSQCDGQVLPRLLFNKGILINCCDKHFVQHKKIMLLNKTIKGMEKLLTLSLEELDKLLAENNLNTDDMKEEEW